MAEKRHSSQKGRVRVGWKLSCWSALQALTLQFFFEDSCRHEHFRRLGKEPAPSLRESK